MNMYVLTYFLAQTTNSNSNGNAVGAATTNTTYYELIGPFFGRCTASLIIILMLHLLYTSIPWNKW